MRTVDRKAKSVHGRMTPTNDRAQRAYRVVRQDDNGNRFVVQTALSRDEAERLVADFESRGHKQLYWIEADERSDAT